MAKIYIGTSGYSYKDWIGPLYPAGTTDRDFLAHYAAAFPFVELNFSYYSMPAAKLLERLTDKAGPGFLFAIKAHKSLTHEVTDRLDKDIDDYKTGISPLSERNQLAAVLVQFPYSFHYTDDNRRHLDRITRALQRLPLALEFRNNEWVRDNVMRELAERSICFVNVDQPDLPKLIKPSAVATGGVRIPLPVAVVIAVKHKIGNCLGGNAREDKRCFKNDHFRVPSPSISRG